MKIIRLFSKKEKPQQQEPFEIPEDWEGLYDTVEVKVIADDGLWEREMTSLVSEISKNRAREIKKSLKENPIHLFTDDPRIKGDPQRTHQLPEYSKSDIQVWSKDISLCDRFVYDVHKPILLREERKVLIKAVIQNLSDHKYKGKHYSEYIKLGNIRIKLL